MRQRILSMAQKLTLLMASASPASQTSTESLIVLMRCIHAHFPLHISWHAYAGEGLGTRLVFCILGGNEQEQTAGICMRRPPQASFYNLTHLLAFCVW